METLIYPYEPHGIWLDSDFEKFMLYFSEQKGISDINFISNDYVWVRQNGNWEKATKNPVSLQSIQNILLSSSADVSSAAIVEGGRDIDYNYTVKKDRLESKRFRTNATSCVDKSGSKQGINIIFRTIPSIPPSLDDLAIEEAIRLCAKPKNGLVLVSGVMGTGKSTLMASILRDIVENDKRYIATFEDPIEFDLLSIPNAQSPIVQGEIRRHLLDFTKVPKNVSRRAVDVCFIGEARDIETLEGMLIAAEMGMVVYCTVHTLNVAETIDRIVSIFPSSQRNFITTLLVNQLRVVIQQRLLPKVGGGRIAIREFLKFEKKHKTALLHTEPEKISLVLQDFVNKDGISLERAAKARLEEGLITEETYYSIKKEQE